MAQWKRGVCGTEFFFVFRGVCRACQWRMCTYRRGSLAFSWQRSAAINTVGADVAGVTGLGRGREQVS